MPQGLSPEASAALLKAYPDFLDRIEGNDLVWKDGTRMRIDGGKGDTKGDKSTRPFEAMLDDPDIKDMFAFDYPVGEKGLAPDVNFDPGRARYLPLFRKMYGDCRAAGFSEDFGGRRVAAGQGRQASQVQQDQRGSRGAAKDFE